MNYSLAGFYIVVGVALGVPTVVTSLDLVLTYRRKHPVGYYVNQFVIAYPWFGATLALLVGALIAHFFLNISDH